jgi:hypothetical protein
MSRIVLSFSRRAARGHRRITGIVVRPERQNDRTTEPQNDESADCQEKRGQTRTTAENQLLASSWRQAPALERHSLLENTQTPSETTPLGGATNWPLERLFQKQRTPL